MKFLLLCFMVSFGSTAAYSFEGQVHQGKVVHVTDGNTLTVQVGHQKIIVDLIGVYAPAPAERQGMRAKKALGNLVFGKTVKVIEYDRHDQGGITGRVYLDDQDVRNLLSQ